MEARDTAAIECRECGQSARRTVVAGHAPGFAGSVLQPTREHYVRLDRAQKAHNEYVDQCRRAGVAPRDLFAEAQRRIRAGEVQAIA